MCGIVGYLGKKECKKILLDGLSELEYRGYDSAGVAIMQNGGVSLFKAVGKLANLIKDAEDFTSSGFCIGIGHTRWATHGKPTQTNAHPHSGESTFVVHNGIIENYAELKEELISEGVQFASQTDTEVIVHLFEKNLKKASSVIDALQKTYSELEGAFAVLLITKSENGKLFFMKKSSPPLLIGLSSEKDEKYFASSETALIGQVNEVVYLKDRQYGWVSDEEIIIFENDAQVKPEIEKN